MFFDDPGLNFDLASFNFQVPINASAAKHTATPTKHNARVSTVALAFIFSPD
jgi:hypothetical protein